MVNMNAEELLQERIQQLEAGEPLESCLVGLPEPEARALRLVASLRALAIEDVQQEQIAQQRAAVLAAASHTLKGSRSNMTSPQSTPPTPTFGEQLQSWFNQLLARPQLAMGLAALATVLILSLVWFGFGGNSSDQLASQTPEPTAPAVVDNSTPAEEDVVEETPAEDSLISVPPTPAAEMAYLPIFSTVLNLTAVNAKVDEVEGLVQIQTGPDSWKTVNSVDTITAGQRIRTGNLSKATITFYDGSQAHLKANTELSIDELNALLPEQGFRTVVMTQWLGDSTHNVQFRGDGGSRYEVKTPAGTGLARGTEFQVLVTADAKSKYIVTEGKVDVSGLNQTVSVTAGQMTNLTTTTPPEQPAFHVIGEGEVTAIGGIWTIAGQTFQTSPDTIIVGNPQVGDLVRVIGHLLADGNRMADFIVLVRPAVNNRFSLTGPVDAIGDTSWTVAAQTLIVNEQTIIDEEITVGSQVQVEGILLPGGGLQALTITLIEEGPGTPFKFSGLVQAINDGSWIISGQLIVVTGDTHIHGNIEVGDVVKVHGRVLPNGSWVARKIKLQDEPMPSFQFTGIVESTAPWLVGGFAFETRDWTDIDEGIIVGSLVRVRGVMQSDGSWVAHSISLLEDELPAQIITYVGVVGSTNPWVINGLPVVVTGETRIIGSITVGSQVKVRVQLLPDGTWQVLSIRLLYPNFGLGCLIFSSPITVVNGGNIQVQHWAGDIPTTNLVGEAKVNHVITLPLCTGWNGTIVIIGNIIVIYQPVVIIINPGQNIPPGCKVSKNGKIKCSNKKSS